MPRPSKAHHLAMYFPPCQLCGAAPASCKSHIIPRQFYKRIRGAEKHILELHVEGEVNRRFSQSGIWEQGILCPACDGKLGNFDSYGYKVLPENIQQQQIQRLAPNLNVYELGQLDVEKFKKFLVGLVWRASRAKHEMFKFVNIGPYESRFKSILTGKDVSWLSRVDCVCVYSKPPRYDKILLSPFQNKCEDINVVQFYLYPWKLLIKLDNRPFGKAFSQTALKTGAPTYAVMIATFSKGEIQLLADLQRRIKRYEGVL